MSLNQLFSTDNALIFQLLICLVCSAFVFVIPQLRKPVPLLSLSVLATTVIYGRAIAGFILTHASVYLFVIIINRATKGRAGGAKRRWQFSSIAMLILAAMFLCGRWAQLDTRSLTLASERVFVFSLNMWVFLRLLTFLWEFGAGRIIEPSLLNYSIWIFLPLTLSGPLIRFSQFEKQKPWEKSPISIKGIVSAKWGYNLLLAAIELTLGIVLSGMQQTFGAETSHRSFKFLIAFGLAPWSFYLTWAGFFLFMECLGLFWGLSLPQSFNRPFGRPNISEFWANWNMTATSVFRDYFFYNRWGLRKANLYINVLIVFLMVGVWHDANLYWALWGLLHGIGFCVFMWYRANRGRTLLLPFRFFENDLVGRVTTYVFVCMCWALPSKLLAFAKL